METPVACVWPPLWSTGTAQKLSKVRKQWNDREFTLQGNVLSHGKKTEGGSPREVRGHHVLSAEASHPQPQPHHHHHHIHHRRPLLTAAANNTRARTHALTLAHSRPTPCLCLSQDQLVVDLSQVSWDNVQQMEVQQIEL